MGYATVALPHEGKLYLGSASGDRIASLALPWAAAAVRRYGRPGEAKWPRPSF